jgi:hypothetical protein
LQVFFINGIITIQIAYEIYTGIHPVERKNGQVEEINRVETIEIGEIVVAAVADIVAIGIDTADSNITISIVLGTRSAKYIIYIVITLAVEKVCG